MSTNYTFTNSNILYDFSDTFIPLRYFDSVGLYTFGSNNFGQLGLQDVINRSLPVLVGSTTSNWASISTGINTAAVNGNGTLWGWGIQGQVGDGTSVAKSSPVQIGALNTWSAVYGGAATFAITTDHKLYGWGNNTLGVLGDGTSVAKSSPVQIGTLTDWNSVSCTNHTLALKTDGTLWVWGANSLGQLGLGDITNRSSPVQVGTANTWSSIAANGSHSIATKTDGTLWAWGGNGSGSLGNSTTTNTSSPIQIGSLTDWRTVVKTYGSHSFAIKTDGTLWGWGVNNHGQLGLGNITNRSSPVQVGTLTNWRAGTGTRNSSNFIKTDGTLWGWGANTSADVGVIGDGTVGKKSSPVQVGALTNWISITAGDTNVAVISS